MRRNAARALAIMPCTVPTSEVWTPPAPGAGMGYSRYRICKFVCKIAVFVPQ